MTRILRLALAGLCASLLLIIAAELVNMANRDEFPLAERVVSPRNKTLLAAPDMEALVDVILERPLFSPSRHPPEIASGVPIESTSEKAPPQLHARLAGVMIRPGVREALFARAGQRPIVVKIGGEIDGWKIAAIEPDRVILSSDFGKRTLKPTNDPEVVRPTALPTNMGLGIGPPANNGTHGTISSMPSASRQAQPSQASW